MLEASHLSWRDALDLIMGALDARLDPQTAGAEGRRWTRALGVVCLTAAGGLLFFTFEYFPFPIRAAALDGRRVGLVIAFALELLVMNWDFWMIAAHPLSPLYWQLASAIERASVNRYGAGTLLETLFALRMAVWAAVIATIATRRTRRRPTPVPART
jgi:hypothetical protein